MQAEFVPFWNSTWKERIFENICCTMVGYETPPPPDSTKCCKNDFPQECVFACIQWQARSLNLISVHGLL